MSYKNKQYIYFHSKEITKSDILWGLTELGLEWTHPDFKVSADDYAPDLLEQVISYIKDNPSVSCTITQDFCPVVAAACHELSIPYVAWVYDAPQASLYRKEALFNTNYIFTFDKVALNNLKEIGIPHVYYSPLAANLSMVSTLSITDEDVAKFGADISFVGGLYHKDYVDSFLHNAPEHIQQEFINAFNSVAFSWNKDVHFHPSFTPELTEYIRSTGIVVENTTHAFPYDYLAENLLLMPAIAYQERSICLQCLAEQFPVTLYTREVDTPYAPDNVIVRPPVSVDSVLYRVYYASKINLGFTIRPIETGVPQRIFDIMSVGGFCLSNFQSDAEELFIPAKEIVLFHSVEDLMDKAFYYLRHDTERLQIGINGYKRVKDCYTYPILLDKILTTVFS